jgi:hypothetical protein
MATKITVRAAAIGAAGCLAVASAAQAGPLAVVNVGAPAVNCAFNTTNAPACQVVVEDAIGTFNVTGDSGVARLQSRNYPGKAPAPAAGDMAYIYRVDLTNVQGILAPICVAKLALDFGPVVKLPYDMPKDNASFDVFVVTTGGLGTVGPSSANQVGNTITFTFSKPVCPGATSYFFGLASKTVKHIPGIAKVFFSPGGGTATTADQVP